MPTYIRPALFWVGFVLLGGAVCLPLHAATIIVNAGSSIQNAINAANPGDTIDVGAGTYTEQLVISKDLSLVGAGSATTTIQAPAVLSTDPTIFSVGSYSSGQATSIVVINGGAAVTMSGFTVSGPGSSGCGSLGFGVTMYGGATLSFQQGHVTHVRDNPLSGCQNGNAIRAGFASISQVGHLIVINTLVDDYQKNGITVSGVGSTGAISNTTVTGAGPQNVIAQNGIQISGGASATLVGNTVSGNECNDSAGGCGPDPVTGVQSGGILLYDAGAVTMRGNNVNNNDAGILLYNDTTVGVGPYKSSNDTLDSNRYENVFVQAGTLALQSDSIGGLSNYAIYALASSGPPPDVADSTVLIGCSSISGPQQVTNNNGSLTTASIGPDPCAGAPVPTPVRSNWMLCLLSAILAVTAIWRLHPNRVKVGR